MTTENVKALVRSQAGGHYSEKKRRITLVPAEGQRFGLASSGFPGDAHPVLTGWYGDPVTTFLSM